MLSMSFISRELYIHTVLRFQSRTFNSSAFTAQHKLYTLSRNICIKDIFCRSGSFLNFTLQQFSKGSQGLSGIASVSLFSFCDWSCKFCATIAANQMRKQKQLRLGHSRFPVLRATCLFRLLVLLSFALIGSCKYGTVRGYTKTPVCTRKNIVLMPWILMIFGALTFEINCYILAIRWTIGSWF